MTLLNEVDGKTAADVMHAHVSALSATVTVGEVREYFAASTSRRLAIIADGQRYVGAISVTDFGEELDVAAFAADHAARGPIVDPGDRASDARDVALAQPSRRVPVVDGAGTLVGIVAIDKRLEKFCS
jgi:CBS domain-containing protein